MKRYFGLFTKNQNNANNVHHSDKETPVIIGESVIKKQEAPVVEQIDNKVVDEVNVTPIPEVIEEKPKRKRRSKKASDSPSDNQEVGDK